MQTPKPRRFQRVTIVVSGMDGSSGLGGWLKQKLESRRGVISAYVSPRTEMVYIIYDGQRIHLEDLQHTIEDLGFETEQLALR